MFEKTKEIRNVFADLVCPDCVHNTDHPVASWGYRIDEVNWAKTQADGFFEGIVNVTENGPAVPYKVRASGEAFVLELGDEELHEVGLASTHSQQICIAIRARVAEHIE